MNSLETWLVSCAVAIVIIVAIVRAVKIQWTTENHQPHQGVEKTTSTLTIGIVWRAKP